jgi:hypothetical protein
MGSKWYAAAPSKQERSRITLNFGLGRADRLLRERVVPGLGRVWFVRQLSWSVAALALRATTNTKASAIGHALEALGCKLEWNQNPDSERLLGKRAFGRDADNEVWAFAKLRTTKHYVQNTHRQAAARTLRAAGGLGFADGARFDAYTLTTTGQQLADAVLDQPVGKGGGKLRTWLEKWILGGEIDATPKLREALAPSYASDEERKLVRARLFHVTEVTGDACARRRNAAKVLGHGRDLKDMLEVATGLREAGHIAHADDVVAARAFGTMLDRARDLVALVSERVGETKLGWPLAEASGDKGVKHAVARLKDAGAEFVKLADTPQFIEPKSRAFVRALDQEPPKVVASVAGATFEVFSVAEHRVMRGALFRVIESSDALRRALEQEANEADADAVEPDETNQTFRLANLHALARDLEGKTS